MRGTASVCLITNASGLTHSTLECCCCPHREYGPIMKQCYYPDSSSQRGKMMFELRKAEAQNLCRAFDRAAGHVNANTRPHPVPGSVPSAAAAAAPASSSAVAAAAPKATAALPKAAAAPSAASRAAPGSGVASVSCSGYCCSILASLESRHLEICGPGPRAL